MSGNDKATWKAISALLDELLDADAERREARLSQVRAQNPALAEQVSALLAQRPAINAQRFLDESVVASLDLETIAGRSFGGYTLERTLGHGGMGTVWLAQRSDGRYEGQAAIKLLNLALLGYGGAERLRREANALAKLAHPSITHLVDAGVSAGQPYLVLEYVEGEPIDQWCDEQRLDVGARVRLFLQVLAAVSHAHGRLVLHRDLKPSNILVTADGRAKLLDFGIAKLLEGEGQTAPPTELTRLVGSAMTPSYAAPEQAKHDELTTATDVYALGVLLYVLLAGAHPTASVGCTPLECLRALLERQPVRLSDAALTIDPALAQARSLTATQLARTLRGDLDNIVGKALKKSPADRYATADAFSDDLRRYLGSKPVSARADSFGYRVHKFVRRHQMAVAAASVTVLALVAGVVGMTWQTLAARREREEALFQRDLATARGNLMDIALQAATDSGRPITQRDILDRSVQLVDKQFGKDPRIAVELLYPIAGQYSGLGDSEKDIAVMQHAAEIAAASGDPQLIGHVACNTVEAELGRGRLDAGRQQLQKGLGALAQVKRPTLGSIVECTRAEAEVAQAEGDEERASERIRAGLATMEKAGRTEGAQFGLFLSLLASTYERTGNLQGAFDSLQRVRRWHESLGRSDTINYLASRRAEARILMAWGEYREARTIVNTIAASLRNATGDGTLPAWFVATEGALRWRFEDLQGAAEIMHAAAQHVRARGAVAMARSVEIPLVAVLADLDRLAEAASLLAQLEAAPELRIDQQLALATARAHLALKRAEPAAAAEVIHAVLADIGYPGVRESAALGAALRLGSRAQIARSNRVHALQMAQAAVSVSERVARDPSHSADVGEALLLLAQAQHMWARREDAAANARRAHRALAHGLGDEHRLTREALELAETMSARRE